MADRFLPLCLGTVMMFGSLEFMSLGSGYDMVLLHHVTTPSPILSRSHQSQCVGGTRGIMRESPARVSKV